MLETRNQNLILRRLYPLLNGTKFWFQHLNHVPAGNI